MLIALRLSDSYKSEIYIIILFVYSSSIYHCMCVDIYKSYF